MLKGKFQERTVELKWAQEPSVTLQFWFRSERAQTSEECFIELLWAAKNPGSVAAWLPRILESLSDFPKNDQQNCCFVAIFPPKLTLFSRKIYTKNSCCFVEKTLQKSLFFVATL